MFIKTGSVFLIASFESCHLILKKREEKSGNFGPIFHNDNL